MALFCCFDILQTKSCTVLTLYAGKNSVKIIAKEDMRKSE